MKKQDRDRLKEVIYEAYMLGQSDGKKTEVILEALGNKFHKNPRTLQNWIYDVRKQREAMEQQLQETDRLLRQNIMQLRHELGLPDTCISSRGLKF